MKQNRGHCVWPAGAAELTTTPTMSSHYLYEIEKATRRLFPIYREGSESTYKFDQKG